MTTTLNGKPAVAGDYKPSEVDTDLKPDNGLLSITFGSDGSATSLLKKRSGAGANLNGIVPRDTDAHRTLYIDSSGGGRRLIADVIRIVEVTPQMTRIAVIDNRENNRFPPEHHILMMSGESGLYRYLICRNPNNRRLDGETAAESPDARVFLHCKTPTEAQTQEHDHTVKRPGASACR